MMPSSVGTLLGMTFSRLTVIHYVGTDAHRNRLWRCSCVCGTEVTVPTSSLRSGNSKSCGCLHKDIITTHGESRSSKSRATKEYRIWAGIIQRCTNPNNPDWESYGGRGITVCDRWRTFEGFLEDMGRLLNGKSSIDRINNNAGYSPENCRWSTRKDQDKNKRTNHLLTHNGITLCVTEWAERIGMSSVTLFTRIHKLGWSIERAITTPTRYKRC